MRTRRSFSSSKSKRKPLRPYILESLEPRRLLTTFVHSAGQDPTSFFFFDEFGHYDRISFFGNITAEVIGAQGGGNTLINLPPAVIGPKPGVNPLDSIFAIYVSRSDLTGGITLAQVPDSNFNGNPITNLVSTPFTGSIGQVTILNHISGQLQTVGAPGNSGEALIGAVTNPFAAVNPARPVLNVALSPAQISNNPFGVLPGGTTSLNAGITVAGGQSLGFCYIGGTVMGQVHFGGAINTFYAGWLITGNTNGEAALQSLTVPQNFTVAGDIQNLLVGTSIGCIDDALLTKPIYDSGFDMFVNGTIGTVNAGVGIFGSINAAGSTGVPNSGADQQEIEFLSAGTTDKFLDGINNPNGLGGGGGGVIEVPGTGVASVGLGGGVFANNNSFAQPEYISNNFNTASGTDNSIVVDGNIQNSTTLNDGVDYYAVPLLAGQTITVQVQLPAALAAADIAAGIVPVPGVDAAVFDPDGREIASDYNVTGGFSTTTGFELTNGQPFQFTSDRPGIYRFAVSYFDNPTMLAQGALRESSIFPYTLSINNVGHMTIGAIVAGSNLCDNPDATNGAAGFGTQNGDLGAVVSGGDLVSNDDGAVSGVGGALTLAGINSIEAENGSVRAIVGATIGEAIGAGITDPTVFVPSGNVGLVESTTGNMDFNNVFADTGILPQAIGGDYQVVSSAGDFTGDLVCNGSIGTVRMQSLVDNRSAVFRVNAANNNSVVGHIDLIDDAGDFGNDAVGGPSINVGPDGVLTYLHVLGGTFENSLFGNTHVEGQTITFGPGQAVPVVESSGAVVTLTPVVTTAVPAPALTVTTYPLDSGGSAIVNVTSTGGLTVTGTGSTPDQEFGIGTIWVQGAGNTVSIGKSNLSQNFAGSPTIPIVSPPTIANAVAPLDVILSGNVQIDAFDIIGGLFGATGIRSSGGNFDVISNTTPGGQIVNIHAQTIGTLSGSGAVGVNLSHSTAAAILPNGSFSDAFPYTGQGNAFPFNGQRNAIIVDGLGLGGIFGPGEIVNINLPQVGNIDVTGTAIGLTANIGSITGTIAAPVVATGSINNVILGSGGILPSGSGALSDAGVYANGVIGNVVGSNTNIRGNVISQSGIQSVNLQNGSIINAQIALYDATVPLSDSDNLRISGTVVPTSRSPINSPILTLGSVVTNGSGGIIGSLVLGGDTGVISSRNGFGILQTTILNPSTGSTKSIYADGYGIRGVLAQGGFNIGSITANGDGSLASTATFSNQVRISESSTFDPLFGFQPNAATDIDKFLSGESATTPVNAITPVVAGVTDTGIIEDSTFLENHNLGSAKAYSIRSATSDVGGVTTFNFANSIGSITTTSLIDGMSIITGKLGNLLAGGDLRHTALTISGRINNLTVHANLTDDSSIIAHGRNGNIGTLNVLGNVDGLIQADGGKINTVTIHGSLQGKIQSKTINKLVLYQNLGAGSLEITGSANLIQLMQDLGPQGNTLTVDGKVNTLKVGSNLTGNIAIKGALGKLLVSGSVVSGSKVTVGSILSLLQVGSDFQAGAVVQAHQVKKVKVNGVNAGTISII